MLGTFGSPSPLGIGLAIIVGMLLFLWWVNGDARARRRRSPAD